MRDMCRGSCLDDSSVCYCLQAANATVARATILAMNELELQRYRAARMEAAIEKFSAGNKSEFGRRLGYKDGAFIRQMLSGDRPIREKTISAIEALPGMRGWFSDGAQQELLGLPGETAEAIDPDSELSVAARKLVDEIRELDGLGVRRDVFDSMGALLRAVRDRGGLGDDMAGD